MTDFEKGEIILIDKPLDWTSFDIVNKVRIILRHYSGGIRYKVGHAGTLDPLATGLVVVCTGKATKQINTFIDEDKEYITTICFGASTPSFDLESEIDLHYPKEHINEEIIHEAIKKFKGDQDQVPPIFSAVKINGKRAYELARKNKNFELQPKKITIKEFELLQFDKENCEATFRIVCSKGTYIRAIARDLSKELSTGGHLVMLRRIRSGGFHIDNSVTMDEFKKKFNPTETNQ